MQGARGASRVHDLEAAFERPDRARPSDPRTDRGDYGPARGLTCYENAERKHVKARGSCYHVYRYDRLGRILMLTMKTKYALKALAQLASAPQGTPMLIADIAEREEIPKKFLEAILAELKQHGILRSRKGRGGGYYLAKSPDTITLASSHSRAGRAARAGAVPEPHRLPALRRLQGRGDVRHPPRAARSSRGIGQGAREHDARGHGGTHGKRSAPPRVEIFDLSLDRPHRSFA